MQETVGRRGGLYCYLITPFDDEGAVNHAILERYADEVIEGGADGLTCVASTTEGVYLTEKERFSVVETVCAVAKGRVPVNVGIGALSTKQSILYAQHAQKQGAATLMLEMQTYLPGLDFKAAYRHYADVARSVNVPIRLYNIPHTTHFDFLPDQIAEMSSIEGIDSVKDATGNVDRVRDISHLCGDRFALFCGRHHCALDSYRHGAIGWEGAYVPMLSGDMVTLHRTLRSRDFEKGAELCHRLAPLFTMFRFYGVPQCIKEISSWTDLNLGKPRLPLSELSRSQASNLRRIVSALEIL